MVGYTCIPFLSLRTVEIFMVRNAFLLHYVPSYSLHACIEMLHDPFCIFVATRNWYGTIVFLKNSFLIGRRLCFSSLPGTKPSFKGEWEMATHNTSMCGTYQEWGHEAVFSRLYHKVPYSVHCWSPVRLGGKIFWKKCQAKVMICAGR